MIKASKTAEFSSQPTKRGRRAWLIGLAVVVALVTIVLLTNAPKQEPVRVWFVRATNELGEKKLVFEGTNGLPRGIAYSACVITGAIHHAEMSEEWTPYSDGIKTNAAARATFTFALEAPPKDAPYYVSWWFEGTNGPTTRWGKFRMACFDFLGTHGMYGLANRFAPVVESHLIPSSEIKE